MLEQEEIIRLPAELAGDDFAPLTRHVASIAERFGLSVDAGTAEEFLVIAPPFGRGVLIERSPQNPTRQDCPYEQLIFNPEEGNYAVTEVLETGGRLRTSYTEEGDISEHVWLKGEAYDAKARQGEPWQLCYDALMDDGAQSIYKLAFAPTASYPSHCVIEIDREDTEPYALLISEDGKKKENVPLNQLSALAKQRGWKLPDGVLAPIALVKEPVTAVSIVDKEANPRFSPHQLGIQPERE